MKKKNLNLIKFIFIILVILTATLPPYTSYAAPNLTISSEENVITTKGKIAITAKVEDLVNKRISFKSSPNEGVIFSPESCTTSTSGNPSTCFVYFHSTKAGTFSLTASTNYVTNNSRVLDSNSLSIKITSDYVSPICEPPKYLDLATNQCKTCEDPNIIVGGKCEKKVTSCDVPRTLNEEKNICECKNPNKEIGGVCTEPAPPKGTDTNYTLLSPLPDGSGGTLKEFESDPTKNPCAFGKYMQIIFQLIIGISAVLAVVMIVYGGIEYMTGGAVSEKENGKETITNAILGLLIALGAWLLLNTLNPQLLNVCLRLPEAKIKIIESFEVAGALGGEFGTWKPIKVNFNTEAYPAAKAAFEKTGIDIAFVLAVFDQETGNGKNVGRCYWKDSGVMMELTPPPNGRRMDQTAFASIMSELREDPNTTPVSCPSPKGGWGGAMGHMQFLPTTWVIYKEKGKTLLGGKTPNPWISQDAIMMAAIYLQALNGKNDMKNAACKYYSGRSCDNRTDNPNMFYGNEVMEKRAFIEMQIAEAIKNGKIKK